jgi:hypothetical protein
MKDLNDIDPLPKLPRIGGDFTVHWETEKLYTLPMSQRSLKEENALFKKIDGEDWRPTDNPLIEVNGKGQMRTKDYPLPEPPETDIPIPCVTESFSFSPSSEQEETPLERAVAALSRLCLAKPDADGWIPHKPGDPMPCDPEAKVRVKTENGSESTLSRASYWWWTGGNIVAWKPAT